MHQETSQPLSAKSRAILYHVKKSLEAKGLLLDTHICNIFDYRKGKFNKKDFHQIIRKYNKNLAQGEIDRLFEELDQDNNNFVFYEYLLSAYQNITQLDNPAQELNRRSKILGQSSRKKEIDILIQIKDLLLQTEDYISVIQIFVTEKDGYLTKQNLTELMNNFDYKDPERQKIVLKSLFGDKHKIEFLDLLQALNLDHDATKINLSEMDIEQSMVLDEMEKSQFIKLQQKQNKQKHILEESRILDSMNQIIHSGIYSIEKIPQALAPYFNYGSELEEPFALLATEMISNKHFFIDNENPTFAKAAGWVHISQLRGDYHLFHAARSVLHRDDSRKGLGAMLQPKDIIQGGFGDCYFLSAIAAIVQDYPELVYRLFVLQKNPAHIFGVRLFIDGIWRTIALDGCFPINQYGSLCGAQPHHNDIWVMLLEKAWAKVYKSFENIHSGFNEEGLLAVSGAPSISLSSRKDNFLQQIQVQFGKGSIITCATSKDVNQLTDAEQQNLGIFAAHAYTILKIFKDLPFQDQKITLLKIRNPWGKKAWKGDWSFSSPIWTNTLRERVNFKKDPQDGTFFISLPDFIMYFDHINISKVNLGFRNSHVTNQGNRFNFYQNRIVIKSKGDYFFTIYQENPRKYKNSSGIIQKSKSWLFLAQIQKYSEDGKISRIQSIASSGKIFKDNTIQTTLEPGVYVLLSNVSWGYWDSHPYTITSYGPDKVQFSPGQAASEILVGQFVESFSEKITSLGGSTVTIYKNTNVSKAYYFDHHHGLGFISITNEDTRAIEIKIRLHPCSGITLLAPHSMPLQLMIMPFQRVTACFLVDPQGFHYQMHESKPILIGV